jgi:hypothetical protein
MQIDVGFGDVLVSEPAPLIYPTLLDMPAPMLKGYPRESVVAEKFEAMVKLGTVNSRMKDFYDLWYIARRFDFEGSLLARAVTATFSNRKTEIDPDPVALTPTFAESEVAQKQWSAFWRRGKFTQVPDRLTDITPVIGEFLRPVAEACHAKAAFQMTWTAPGPWSSR